MPLHYPAVHALLRYPSAPRTLALRVAMKSPSFILFALMTSICGDASACRPIIEDPLQHMADARPGQDIASVFVGEIIGVRDADRLAQLRRCHPQRAVLGSDRDADSIACIEAMNMTYEIEVYPTDVVQGKPAFPSRSIAGGCLTSAPKVGTEALVFVSKDGSSLLRIRAEDDAEFGWPYDDAYLDKVRECAEGQCRPE